MAVNHRGDSDSTGAIGGNLLGVLHGEGWLPAGWADRVEGIDVVRTVAADLWTEHFRGQTDEAASTHQSTP